MLLTCLSFAVIAILITFLGYSLWKKRFCQHLPGTKPSLFNILGDVVDIWRADDLHPALMDLLRDKVRLYKKQQLFCFWLLYEPIIFIFKADAARDLLLGVKMIGRSSIYDRVKCIVGTGLLTSEGTKWKSRRKLLAPCFHYGILKNFLTAFNEGAENLVTWLKEETKKEFTFVEIPLKICALDILCKTILGVQTDVIENEFLEQVHSLNRVLEILMESIWTVWLHPSILFWNSKTGKEYLHHGQVLKQFTRKVIRQKKESYLRGECEIAEKKQKSLVDLLLQKHFETQELSEEHIREEVDTFTNAGYETTATSLMWALYLIGLYPDVQAKLREEMDQIFGKDTERQVTERDLQDLLYLDCVLKESNRVYATVPLYIRQSNEDTTICGYTVPKRTSCAVLTYFLHRDEDIFPDPEAFIPERFLPENAANIPTCAYIPFSAGPRKCIGYKFAEMEMKVIVSSILRNFTIESLDDRSKIRPLMKTTLQPSSPIRIRFRFLSN